MRKKTPLAPTRAGRRAVALVASIALVGALGPVAGIPTALAAPASAAAASETAAPEADAPARTNGILVTLETGTASGASLLSDAASTLAEVGIEVVDVVSTDEDAGTTLVSARAPEGESDAEAAEAALGLPGVTAAQPNYVYDLIEPVAGSGLPVTSFATGLLATGARTAAILANDPFAQVSDPQQEPNQYWLYDTALTRAWERVRTDGSVTIVTLDSGVKLDHEDLAGNVLADLAHDAYREQPLSKTAEETGTGDPVGHGTHVAGIAAAVAGNGVGVAGSSYNAKLLPVSVVYPYGSGYSTDTRAMLSGLEYVFGLIDGGAVENARVVNLSLGGYGSDNNDVALHDAIRRARSEYGMVVVCAGGNGKAGYTNSPLYPSDWEECVSVTALDQTDRNILGFDYNAEKDISAPGASIWSTFTSYSQAAGGYYSGSLTGTSMASPMVAGTVALMFAAHPEATPDEVIEALYASADPVDDSDLPAGVTTGSHGSLDAAGALEALDDLLPAADVRRGDWYYDAVVFVLDRGIMGGYSDGTGRFGPNDDLTREQAAQILYNYLGGGASAPSCGKADVTEGEWYAAAVDWCVASGVMTGYDDGSNEFGVGDTLTREQLARILANIAREGSDAGDASAFYALPDWSETSGWALDDMRWAVSRGLINGAALADGTRELQPHEKTDRAQVATITLNAIEGGLL